tara:strand:- start:174 stop:452 length:279 start_codon:yes stop_codon:yes gene_type:complete
MNELREVIISLLSYVVMLSFILTTIAITWVLSQWNYNLIIGLVSGVLISTLSYGVIFLAIQNNEYLKEIRNTRTMLKMNVDLLKEIRDNTKK